MRNMFGMFLLAFWVIRSLKCEVVNILKFESSGVPIRPFEYLSMLIFLEHTRHACTHMTHMPIMMSQGSHMMQTLTP